MYRVFLLFLTFLSFSSFCQEKEGIWIGDFDLGLNLTKNTQNTFQFHNIFLIEYKTEEYRIIARNNISFINKNGDNDLLNKGNQNIKYEFITNRFNLGINSEHYYDISRNIEHRYSTGLGISFNFSKMESQRFNFGFSFQREKELLIDAISTLENRLSTNFDFVRQINKNIELTTTNKYLPNVKRLGDFRWNTSLSLRLKISTNFALNINFLYNYDSNPSEDIKESDYQLINSFSYSL